MVCKSYDSIKRLFQHDTYKHTGLLLHTGLLYFVTSSVLPYMSYMNAFTQKHHVLHTILKNDRIPDLESNFGIC